MRLSKVQEMIAGTGSVLALAPGEDFRYVVGWTPLGDERLTFLLVGEHQVRLVIASVNAEEAVAHLGKEFPVARFTDDAGPDQTLEEALLALQPKKLLVSDDARYAHARMLAEVSQKPLALASDIMAPLRMQKDQREVELLTNSQQINDAAMLAAFDALQVGMTELELADVIRRAFIANGADREAFIIVAAGEHSALPHHSPTTTPLAPGPVLLDIGCFYEGYASDMTRVAYLGEPTSEFRRVHAIVEEAVEHAHRTAKPGVAAEEVDRAARTVIADAGYGPQFVHRVGHGIGLSVHEPPSVMETNRLPLPLNAAFSIEPGIYLPGQFGVRLEEVVVNRADGAEILSRVSRDIFVKALS